MAHIIQNNGSLLAATLLLSIFSWMFFSTVLTLTEFNSPDQEMFDTFGSLLRCLWAEVINLHGEWPWADYTATGKGIGTVIALFSIMIFCIPISIFGESFMKKVSEENSRAVSHEDIDRRPWQYRARPCQFSLRQNLYDIFYAHLHTPFCDPTPFDFRCLRLLIVLMVIANVTTTIVMTVDLPGEFGEKNAGRIMAACMWVDALACPVFTVELLCRIIITGLQHPCSFIGACDVISLSAIWATLNPSFRAHAFHPVYSSDMVDDAIVIMRLLRLFSLESYFSAIHTLRTVFRLNKWPIMRAGGALVSVWFMHATSLYLLEHDPSVLLPKCDEPEAAGDAEGTDSKELFLRTAARPVRRYAKRYIRQAIRRRLGDEGEAAGDDDDDEEEEEDMPMAYRYRSILTALQYSIVHLFGDYPEVDYTFYSKAIHFVGIMGGIAIIATFTGVFSSSFIRYLAEQRQAEMKNLIQGRMAALLNATRVLQRAIRLRRRKKLAADQAAASAIAPPPVRQVGAFTVWARSVVTRRTPGGARVMNFFNAALLCNLFNSMVSTMPEVDAYPSVESFFLWMELLYSMVFAFEWTVRIVAQPATILTPWRMFDFFCILPGVLQVAWEFISQNKVPDYWETLLEAFVVIRVVRILDFPYLHREAVMIARALRDALPQLAIPAYLSLNVWISTSSLFLWFENFYKDNPEDKWNTADAMTSVPAAMYWCCIFLTGEWANIDFSFAASRLCIFYVIFGIAMFSLPVGIIVESVRNTIKVTAQEEADMRRLLADNSKTATNLETKVE